MKGLTEEINQCQDQFEKIKGQPINFGSIIQLMHWPSHKFLTFDPEKAAEQETENLKCFLADTYSDGSCFRIQNFFKYQ